MSIENKNTSKIEGYISKFSYSINEDINLYLNIPDNNIKINVYNYFNGFDNPFYSFETNGKIQTLEKLSFAEGCKWDKTISFKINDTWESGLYIIKLFSDTDSFFIPFIIKNPNKTNFLILMNTNTWQAYNNYGGASYYRYNCKFNSKYGKKGKIRPGSSVVTFDRPNPIISKEVKDKIKNYGKNIQYKSHLFYGEMYLLEWLHKNNYSYNLISDRDLHDEYPIQNYNCLILNCHPEYWTPNMVNNVTKNAKNIISLGGNVAYRKINFNSHKMIKNNLWNPNTLKNITGSYFTDYDADTYAPYKIINKHSWVFKEINIKPIFGNKTLNSSVGKNGCSGHETDKCIIHPKYIIARGMNIGKNRHYSGGGDILYFITGKRKIFSVGSITYTGGLYTDKIIEKITKNVVNYFSISK